MQRHLTFEGGYNIRDMGGYPTQDGGTTRYNVLIRSGGLDRTSPEAQEQLLAHGIKTVIDLRDEWEAEKYLNPFTSSPRVTYHLLPLIGNALSESPAWKDDNGLSEMHEYYGRYLAQCQPQIGRIVTAIAESDSMTLFHCYAGKDRTGVIAALILGAMNVSDEVIIEDYTLSEIQVAHLLEEQRNRAKSRGQDVSRLDRVYGAHPETMRLTLTALKETYQGYREYLALCGVTEEHLERLRTRFVESSSHP